MVAHAAKAQNFKKIESTERSDEFHKIVFFSVTEGVSIQGGSGNNMIRGGFSGY